MRTQCFIAYNYCTYLLTYVVKVHCSLRLLDNIEEIGRNDANIE